MIPGGTLHVASTNAGKLAELTDLLAPHGMHVVPPPPGFDVVEDGATFAENAIKKAEALARLTGTPAMADDSGLCVRHLGGAPGLYSARYSGVTGAGRDAANCTRLLRELADVPPSGRAAELVCVLAYCRANAPPRTYVGTLAGHIGAAASGSGGFGYDPLFVPAGQSRSLAELPAAYKRAQGHRAAALRACLADLVGATG